MCLPYTIKILVKFIYECHTYKIMVVLALNKLSSLASKVIQIYFTETDLSITKSL